MNREESLAIISLFITELGGAAPAAPAAPASPPQVVAAPKDDGLGGLIQGCKGFEIGGSPCCPPPAPAAPAAVATVKSQDAVSIKKALGGLSNGALLLSLLQYYAAEVGKPVANSAMLKTTKEQIMKHWPQLAFTPLFTALDVAAS